MKYHLIDSINTEVENTKTLIENCLAMPNPTKLFESADRMIGKVIAALKAGKNPFETISGSREVIAGLMLLAKDTNREALNINSKKFDLISQFTSEDESVQKDVAALAQKYGQSLIKNLDAYVAEQDKREILTKKLVQLQNAYSHAKQKATPTSNDIQSIAV